MKKINGTVGMSTTTPNNKLYINSSRILKVENIINFIDGEFLFLFIGDVDIFFSISEKNTIENTFKFVKTKNLY